MPPERCLVYDDHRLVLGDAARARPGHVFTAAELAGYSKTASRLYAILRPWPWATISPIHWRSPEQLLFHLGPATTVIHDLALLSNRLEQLEALTLQPQPPSASSDARVALLFARC